MVRCALYARVFSPHAGIPIAEQMAACDEYARGRGWVVVERYEDIGPSGRGLARPGLQRALKDAEARAWEHLIVYRFDRLNRDEQEALELIRRLKHLGVTVRSCTEAFP